MAKSAITPNNVHPFPAIRPGFKLVPARIGRGEQKQIVYVECPLWCTEDHVDNFQYDLGDITHYSDMSGVTVPTMTSDYDRATWSARIASDPTASEPGLRAAHILVDDETPDEARLTPEMAEELADELVGFAAAIRHAARTARLHNASQSVPQQRGEAV
ncbi:hypothetical protein AB0O67_24400 [Streptomyces sp. NPDC086077]|uniref:DUF6907 domain-containing protein n=1 Tax=Streptomyces sp. NPDC086077 TaxID=3154862 RepID=UPI0034493E3C